MGYMHIDNLYKNQDIMLFRECYAMEKIHGTSAHITYRDGQLKFSSGGVKHDDFVQLFNQDDLLERLRAIGCADINCVVFGEAYGGKCQKMAGTYGTQLRFVAFEVKCNDSWLSVPAAYQFCKDIGVEFVYYNRIPTTQDAINRERDADSIQAIRNGMGVGHMREGVVLRPLIEVTKNNGKRIICKHKCAEFCETKSKRETSPLQQKQMEDAREIAEEWVTLMRLSHVCDALQCACVPENLSQIVPAMVADVKRESFHEVAWNKAVTKAIGAATASLVKATASKQLI